MQLKFISPLVGHRMKSERNEPLPLLTFLEAKPQKDDACHPEQSEGSLIF